MSELVIVERDRDVLVVRLHRPQALNALNTALARDLFAEWDCFGVRAKSDTFAT